MITEDYVSFEIAKLLKKKGFDETCRAFWKVWNGETNLCYCNSSHTFEYCHNTMLENYNDDDELNIAAPTLQMAMKWLREVHKLHIQPYTSFDDNGNPTGWWHCFVEFLTGKRYPIDINFVSEKFDSHEQACDACIKYCLENLI